MSTTFDTHGVNEIAETASVVWRFLAENGPRTVPNLAEAIDAPRDLVMQALGWLAHEDKIQIEPEDAEPVIYLH